MLHMNPDEHEKECPVLFNNLKHKMDEAVHEDAEKHLSKDDLAAFEERHYQKMQTQKSQFCKLKKSKTLAFKKDSENDENVNLRLPTKLKLKVSEFNAPKEIEMAKK